MFAKIRNNFGEISEEERKIEEISAFVNAAQLYIRMKMTEEVVVTQVAWVLLYV